MYQKKVKALVTGATSGIGEMLVRRLAALGHPLVITGRNQGKLDGLSNELQTELIGISLDLTDGIAVERFANVYAADASVVVNAAADFGLTKPLTQVTAREMLEVYQTNVVSPLIILGHALPAMIRSGYGRIIDISSTSGLSGYAGRMPYCTSKHAVLGLTRTINQEIKDECGKRQHDVKAFCVCPGPIDGERIEKQIRARMKMKGETDFAKARRSFSIRLGRFLDPEEVVDRILSLMEPGVRQDEIVLFR